MRVDSRGKAGSPTAMENRVSHAERKVAGLEDAHFSQWKSTISRTFKSGQRGESDAVECLNKAWKVSQAQAAQ